MWKNEDTICAIATPGGSGAIGLVRISGTAAIAIANDLFEGKDLNKAKTQSLHFGNLKYKGEVIDEVLLSLFKAPHSYTGEDVVEFSCHGSSYILSELMEALLEKGARLAEGGEFTMRAFANGKMDLTQAEAVADLIASESKAAHDIAMNQMKGGFSKEIQALRQQLIDFAALVELELDFGEEDVEFADRDDLKALVNNLTEVIQSLIASFKSGNVIKNGIPTAIVGAPNVGKSTLLNALLKEDKAIVSNIAGTTRDSIEDVMQLGGMSFRFIDTAGIRETEDVVESIGIQRTFEKLEKAQIVLLLVDANNVDRKKLLQEIEEVKKRLHTEQELLLLLNKSDLATLDLGDIGITTISISALKQEGLSDLEEALKKIASRFLQAASGVTVSNVRHLNALKKSDEALQRVMHGLENQITGDFLAMDIRQALHDLGEITGKIDMDRDILGSIFSRFCIGK